LYKMTPLLLSHQALASRLGLRSSIDIKLVQVIGRVVKPQTLIQR